MKKDRKSPLLLAILFFVMTVTIFGPIELYFTNSGEFWFSFSDMLKAIAIIAGITLAALLILGFLLRGRGRDLYAALLFSVTVALYIQGNFANINYGVLDGKTVDWGAHPAYALLDTLGWIVLLAGAVLLWVKKRELFHKIQKYMILFILAIQVLTLGYLAITTDVVAEEKSSHYLSTDGIYEVSSQDNVIVFVLDAFDESYLNEIFSAEPEKYETIFKDFTYFDNASAGGARTKLGLPIIVTGQAYPGDITYPEYIAEAFNADGLYTSLKDKNYRVGIYTYNTFVPGNADKYVDNLTDNGYEVSSYSGLASKYLSLTLYKYVPHVLKQFFWLYSGEFDQFKEGSSAVSYVQNDVNFYNNLVGDKLSLDDTENALKIIHLNGPHPPYTMDASAHPVDESESSAIEQGKGALYIVEEYARQMKELGIYDNSMIVIMADHGDVNDPAHGILLVKDRGISEEFQRTSAPVSYFDLHNTIFSYLGENKGSTFFTVDPHAQRTRYFYLSGSDSGNMNVVEYEINGDLNTPGNRAETGRVLSPNIENTTYKYGTTLTFGANNTATQYISAGVSGADMNTFSWTDGKEAIFDFDLENAPQTDLTVTLDLLTVYSQCGPQTVRIYANDTLCFEETLDKGGIFEFTIPAASFDSNALSLRFELPDAVRPYDVFGEGNDGRTLSLALQGLTISQDKEAAGFSITEIIGVPLAALMRLCYSFLHHYSLAIVLFTLLTKVILFPVSLWVQKNGISMVRLTPELNRLKIKYYGDKDTIAEETQALYKREHYRPLSSTIPMLVQLVLLLGVIGAVKQVLGGSGSILSDIPSKTGGWTYLMPLAAGATALALGLAQNHLNPLQREQSRKSQWMTNGLSIAISLFLGMFVSLGVCIYWICSNLFSILQQLLLNVVLKPAKYIDYEALEQSKQELASIDSLSANISKEDKKREKADYKRFFSVANKHLVFYSEKSGFFKYFKDVIEYLLKRSNVIIHYVTSDPKDQIFEMAKTQPRIRAYYIGENRLITLMMKMDADIVVMTVPDLENYHLKRSYVRKDIEYIYMFHYPLSTHMVLHTGALDHYDTIFCVGDFQFDEIRAAERVYSLPEKKLISAGYGQLEQLYASYKAMPCVERARPKILIAPSWQADNILDSCIDGILDQLLDKGYEVVVRPHPEYMKRYKPRMDQIVERYKGRESSGLRFELDFTSNNSIFDSDALITDWSGTAYEFSFVTLKPAVFIDTPAKINNPDYVKLGIEPLEFSLRSQVGIRVSPDDLEGLDKKIGDLLKNGREYKEKILAIREKYIANFGQSGKVGGHYILSQLIARQNEKAKKNHSDPAEQKEEEK